MKVKWAWVVCVAVLFSLGCGRRETIPAAAQALAPVKVQPAIVFLGDSLTAGFGLESEETYPALIEKKIQAEKLPYRVVNAGVSGDTTAGGLSRMEWIWRGEAKMLFVALGANDGLRGVPVEESYRNLEAIVQSARAHGCLVVLAGMKLPTNYGETYRQAFERIYRDLAKVHGLTFIPFLLEGVGGRPEFLQADGLHPNREGQKKIAETVWKALRPLL